MANGALTASSSGDREAESAADAGTDDLAGALGRGPVRPRPEGMTVLDLLDSSVRECPDHTAVVHPAGTLTYRELDQLATAVASRIRGANVQRGVLVPLLLDDCLAVLIAMIGTMKAGAAFVPFNINWPTARLAALLDELSPSVAIGRLPAGVSRRLHVITVPAGAHACAARARDLPRPAPGDPIYGFFTSGSTGRPKCAINIHRGLVNRFLSMTELFADDGVVVLQNSFHTFDSSIWQLLWPLTRRATVVIPDRNGILDYGGTLIEIERHGVTMTDFVPTIFNLLVEHLTARPQDLRMLSSLRQILIGGEAANPHTVRIFRDLLPGVRITNTYGPTEASIGSVFHAIGDDDLDIIPLGRPLPNTCVLLLDKDRRPAARGGVGEIYLGGLCVGAGYHGDPERTAAAFVPNPYPHVPGSTLYRTGDFGWFRDDGELMFSGRRDAQVQIAGTRIDLGEVESVLTGLTGVRQVKVMADGTESAVSLVCFYCAQPPVPADELRARAAAVLPDGLIPSRFICLDVLPLLSNGKVDVARLRARLADPGEGEDPSAGSGHGDLERAIAGTWRKVLGFAVTGDDFFRIGGTSLTAARLAVELESAYGVPVNVRDLMRMPTIPAQAQFIRGGQLPSCSAADAVREDLDSFLAQPLRHVAGPEPAEPGAILLLGATGFIGVHVLDALITATDRPVICLARAADDRQAGERVHAALAGIGRHRKIGELTALACDVRASQLGLPERAWCRLAAETGVIIDAGGLVDSLRDYAAHRATNVDGVRTLLRLAVEQGGKRFVMLSTTTVRPAPGAWLPEDFMPRHSVVPADGYSQSKWVAEQLVRVAAERGTKAAVLRLGEVMADSRTGHANPRSALTMILRLCWRLGACFPTSAQVDWTPVNSVARLVAACALEAPVAVTGTAGEVINAVAPASVSVSGLMGRLGGPDGQFPELEYHEFLDRAEEAIGTDEVARCLAVLRSGYGGADPLAGVLSDACAGTESVHAAKLAHQLELAWGQPLDSELDTMIARLKQSPSSPVLETP